MTVSPKDRKDYEQGRKDERKNFFDKAVHDVTVQHPDTPAYYKGRKGEQLDKDKGKSKK